MACTYHSFVGGYHSRLVGVMAASSLRLSPRVEALLHDRSQTWRTAAHRLPLFEGIVVKRSTLLFSKHKVFVAGLEGAGLIIKCACAQIAHASALF